MISLETEINQTWIWLSNNSTETQAIQRLMNSKFAKSLCLFNRRLAFEGPNAKFKIINGKIRYEQAMQGQILLLLTNNWLKEIQFSCRFPRLFQEIWFLFSKNDYMGSCIMPVINKFSIETYLSISSIHRNIISSLYYVYTYNKENNMRFMLKHVQILLRDLKRIGRYLAKLEKQLQKGGS